MQLHDEFTWSVAKAKANFRKHGVSFEHAATLLADEAGDFTHHEEHDAAHSNHEDRYITIGSYPLERTRVLIIVWTEEKISGADVTRIISARQATPTEKKDYEKYILHKMGS